MVERAPARRTDASAETALTRRRRLRLVLPAPAYAGMGITEGAVAPPIRGRDGFYRRGLAVADALVAAAVLSLVALLSGSPDPGVLIALAPAIVLVNKIAG